MVHTRHSGDVEVDSPPRFLSLEDKRSRKSRPLVSDVDEHDSDHSGIVYKDNNHSIFEEKLVESRLRPRTGPGRAYNYVYGDSSEDDLMSRHRRARMLKESPFKVSRRDGRRAVMRGEPEPSSDEEEEPSRGRWRSAKTISVPKIRSREQPQDPHDDTRQDEPDGELEEDEEGDEEDDEDDDANNSALRRSSRLRKRPFRFRGANKDVNKDDTTTASLEREKRRRSDPNNSNEEFDDMYSRVKRPRTRKADRGRRSASHSDGTNDDEKIDSADGTQQERRSYSLREHKPRTQLYIAPAIEAIKKKPKQQSLFRETPPRRIHKKAGSYRSPAHRRAHFRKRHAFHGSSSSTSSDPSDSGTETSDEQRFSRRKAKSMNKARSRICPLNFTPDMVSSSAVLKDRVRTGASLADVDPMEIDKSVRFDSVGGLQKHITALKEMVVFPLLYPEFYERFKVAPSRGVLFYGPPGTGKTLVARALANECSQGTQKVAFFMRKGADCLSKWVGEAERQLRLLFDKAYEMRPSIIFFDEIDGLAPVRSSRQDQIHSSIVSTLLALMDGIDSRGEIVVIGATNRVDAIDPALRRPGRFDREFHFPLPNLEDRERIFKIHTKNWNPPLRDDFIAEMAEKCSGYCGADIKSLVTEATHNALRRHYPQIYTTSDKLQLDISSITLTARDFAQGMTNIVPASQRAVPNPALALEASVRPLLSRALTKLQDALCGRFPFAKLERQCGAAATPQQGGSSEGTAMLDIDLPSDEEENMPSIFLPGVRGNRSFTNLAPSPASFLQFSSGSSSFPVVFRPRMLVSGAQGQGQSVHLAPAALHLMEHLPVHALCSATLFAASAKMPEEACSNVFHEAKRTAPSIIFMPYINELWGVISDSLRVTFMTLIRGMSPSTPILLLATSEGLYSDLDDQLKMLFSFSGGEVVEVDGPNKEERCQFFSDLILHQTVRPPPTHKQAASGTAIPEDFHFFPQESKNHKNKTRMLQSSSVKEVCQASNLGVPCYSQNPRSKQTISTNCSPKVGDIRGSGGEGSLLARAQSVRPLQSKGNLADTKKLQLTTVSVESKVRVIKSCTSRFTAGAIASSSKAKQIVFKMATQTKATAACRLRRKGAAGAAVRRSTRSKQTCRKQQGRGRYSGKKNRNQNYNHSNCGMVPLVTLPPSPVVPMKLYPSLKSPYHKKLQCQEELGVFEEWLLYSASTHWSRSGARRVLEPLAKAADPEPRKLTDREQRKLRDQEEDTLRELRIFLRDILSKLGREKKFSIFTKPVDTEEVPDYTEIIKNPMDLSTMMANIDLHKYNTASAFLDDIFLISSNALEYNPDHGPTDRAIRHRACALRDMAQALLRDELDPEFERLCQEITESRKRRGVDSSQTAPAFYRTRPLGAGFGPGLSGAGEEPADQPIPEGCRYSRRVRGLEADQTLPLEAVEKTTQMEKTLLKVNKESPEKEEESEDIQGQAALPTEDGQKPDAAEQLLDDSMEMAEAKDSVADISDCKCPSSSTKGPSPVHSGKTSKGSSDSKLSSAAKRASIRKKCPWLATRRRRRFQSTPSNRAYLSPSQSHDRNSQSDGEQDWGDESMDTRHSPTAKPNDVWETGHRSHREYSPVSAANPANVSVAISTRTRSSLDTIPAIQDSSSADRSKPKAAATNSPAGAEDASKAPKAVAARSLDVDLMVVAIDSGLGSESNGDSRDSLDHNNSSSNRTAAQVDGENRVAGEEETGASTSTAGGPSFARTRARTQNPLQLRALAALEEESRVVRVDKEHLSRLLDTVVERTEGFNVEKLQHMYSILSCSIYSHRRQADKTQLLQEMEDTVQTFC